MPLPDELAVLVVHSGITRSLDETRYAERRAECEADAAELGLVSLRDAAADQVRERPRARHVVSENARAGGRRRAAGRRARGLGRLLSASHRSLRDDFEVSTPELDLLVAALDDAGAVGARLTGAELWGLRRRTRSAGLSAGHGRRGHGPPRGETGLEPTAFVCRAAAGAGLLTDGRGAP